MRLIWTGVSKHISGAGSFVSIKSKPTMARPTDGKIAKADSRTALFAHIAARLAERPFGEDSEFFKRTLEVNVNAKAGRDAAKARGAALKKWLLVQEADLDLDVSLLRFTAGERSSEEIFRLLQDIPGVRQLIRLGRTGDVLAVVLFDGARARRELRALIQERLGMRPEWEEIEEETFEPTLQTWRSLAKKVAGDENLQIS